MEIDFAEVIFYIVKFFLPLPRCFLLHGRIRKFSACFATIDLVLSLERGEIRSTSCGKHADDFTFAILVQLQAGTPLAVSCANKILNRI